MIFITIIIKLKIYTEAKVFLRILIGWKIKPTCSGSVTLARYNPWVLPGIGSAAPLKSLSRPEVSKSLISLIELIMSWEEILIWINTLTPGGEGKNIRGNQAFVTFFSRPIYRARTARLVAPEILCPPPSPHMTKLLLIVNSLETSYFSPQFEEQSSGDRVPGILDDHCKVRARDTL